VTTVRLNAQPTRAAVVRLVVHEEKEKEDIGPHLFIRHLNVLVETKSARRDVLMSYKNFAVCETIGLLRFHK
jgi:hypothetical protein